MDKLMEQADALLETTLLKNKEKKETVVPDSQKKNLSLYLIILSISS
jgi:hypothetical protein